MPRTRSHGHDPLGQSRLIRHRPEKIQEIVSKFPTTLSLIPAGVYEGYDTDLPFRRSGSLLTYEECPRSFYKITKMIIPTRNFLQERLNYSKLNLQFALCRNGWPFIRCEKYYV